MARRAKRVQTRQRAQALSTQSDEALILELGRSLYRLWRWMVEPDSDEFYESLNPEQRKRFNELSARAAELHFAMQRADIARIAARARVQMEDIEAAAADVRQRIERQREIGETLGAISSFLNIVTPLLLSPRRMAAVGCR